MTFCEPIYNVNWAWPRHIQSKNTAPVFILDEIKLHHLKENKIMNFLRLFPEVSGCNKFHLWNEQRKIGQISYGGGCSCDADISGHGHFVNATFYLIWPNVVYGRGGVRSNVAVGCFFLCKSTDKCKILTFSLQKSSDSALTQAVSSWLNSDSNGDQAWFDSDSTHILDFHGRLISNSTHLSQSRVKFNSRFMSRAQPWSAQSTNQFKNRLAEFGTSMMPKLSSIF